MANVRQDRSRLFACAALSVACATVATLLFAWIWQSSSTPAMWDLWGFSGTWHEEIETPPRDHSPSPRSGIAHIRRRAESQCQFSWKRFLTSVSGWAVVACGIGSMGCITLAGRAAWRLWRAKGTKAVPPREQIVNTLPLDSLWTDAGPLKAKRERYLTPDGLQLYMSCQQNAAPFVIADLGKPLRWVEWEKYWGFWREVEPHLVSPENLTTTSGSGDYCYVASEWSVEDGERVNLLETHRRRTLPEHAEPNGIDVRPNETKPGLSAVDRQYYLGIYRYAVRRFQPIIEERTGVQLGNVCVKDVSELHHDMVMEAKRGPKGFRGLLQRVTDWECRHMTMMRWPTR